MRSIKKVQAAQYHKLLSTLETFMVIAGCETENT